VTGRGWTLGGRWPTAGRGEGGGGGRTARRREWLVAAEAPEPREMGVAGALLFNWMNSNRRERGIDPPFFSAVKRRYKVEIYVIFI
jgi:hypothetical protein